jgi:hypothetical protein
VTSEATPNAVLAQLTPKRVRPVGSCIAPVPSQFRAADSVPVRHKHNHTRSGSIRQTRRHTSFSFKKENDHTRWAETFTLSSSSFSASSKCEHL